MSEITVYWKPSNALLRQEFIATGVQPATGDRKLSIDLVALTLEQRELLLTAQDKNVLPYLTQKYGLLDTPNYSGEFIEKQTLTLEASPTLEQVLEMVRERMEIKVEARRREKAENERRAAVEQRNKALVERAETEIAALEAAGDLEGLRHYSPGPMEAMDWVPYNRRQSYDVTSAIKRLEAAARNAEMHRWAEMHGSERLRKCLERDYRCDRIYVFERAVQEAPGYTVDFYGKARWNERTNPSHDALMLEEEALELAQKIGATGVGIYWLTSAPQDQPDSDHDDELPLDFDCEAIIIHGYLGKYDLVKYV